MSQFFKLFRRLFRRTRKLSYYDSQIGAREIHRNQSRSHRP